MFTFALCPSLHLDLQKWNDYNYKNNTTTCWVGDNNGNSSFTTDATYVQVLVQLHGNRQFSMLHTQGTGVSLLQVSGKPTNYTHIIVLRTGSLFTFSVCHGKLKQKCFWARKELSFRAFYKGVSHQCWVCHSGRLFCSRRKDTWKQDVLYQSAHNCRGIF